MMEKLVAMIVDQLGVNAAEVKPEDFRPEAYSVDNIAY